MTPRDMNMARVATDDDDDHNLSVFTLDSLYALDEWSV